MIDLYSLTLTILIAGLLGGVINYFMVHVKVEVFSNHYMFVKSIFLGIGASALIPLFLNLIGSKLLEPAASSGRYPALNYFVIGGFCLAGAIYSKRFIEDIYGRISKVEQVAKDAKQTAEEAKVTTNEIEQAITEADDTSVIVGQEELLGNPVDQKALKFRSIIRALIDSHYVYRTYKGISNDTGIELGLLKDYLEEMQASGLVTSKLNKNGNSIFKAS